MSGSSSSLVWFPPLPREKTKWPMYSDFPWMKENVTIVQDILTKNSNILLYGPIGCGKTTFAHAIRNETPLPFFVLPAAPIRHEFENVFVQVIKQSPSVVFIDNLDLLTQHKELVDVMLMVPEVTVIGATNNLGYIDPALREPGKFDTEIFVGLPDESARLEILSRLTRKLKIEGPIDLEKLAQSTPSFGATDLDCVMERTLGSVVRRMVIAAGYNTLHVPMEVIREGKVFSTEHISKAAINMGDMEEALKKVRPCISGLSDIAEAKLEDIIGLDDNLKDRFKNCIIGPIKYPMSYKGSGLVNRKSGFLLHGPGCDKRFIGEAIANDAGAYFSYISVTDLLQQYDGMRQVQELFNKARAYAPWILFFHQLDMLHRQGEGVNPGLVLDQLIHELSDQDKLKDVYVIGSTSSLDGVDSSLLPLLTCMP